MKKLVSALAGILIFCLVPILAWGIADWDSFFSNSYRSIYIYMMIVLSVLVVIFVPNEGKGSGKGVKEVKSQKYSLLFLQIIPVLILLSSGFLDSESLFRIYSSEGIRLLGLVIALLGFVLMNWSVIALGRQFSVEVTIQEGHKLITDGPYKYFRHPRYIGILGFFGGIPLIYNTWMPYFAWLILLVVLLWRIKDEEKMMEEEFGEEWRRYKRGK